MKNDLITTNKARDFIVKSIYFGLNIFSMTMVKVKVKELKIMNQSISLACILLRNKSQTAVHPILTT